MRRYYLYLTIIQTLLCFMTSTALAQKWGKITDEEWAMEAPADYPDANALIIFDRAELEVTVEGIWLTRHVRVKVLNEAGMDEAGDLSFSYVKGDKIKGLRAQTITPDGKKHRVKKKQIFTKTSGQRQIKTISFPNVTPGCILEYKYRNVNKRFTMLDPWYFQSEIYTVESEFTLKLVGGFTYSSVMNNVPGIESKPKIVQDRKSEIRTYTWTRRNVPPIKNEPLMGAIKNYYSALSYQLVSYKDMWQKIDFIKGWPDLGEKFTKLISEYTGKTDDLEATVKEVTAGATDDLSQAKAIYHYVTTNIRTQADEQNGYMIHDNLKELIEAGYGTSEEKNILLTELLRLAGLQAWPVLISTRNHARFNPKIFQLQQFNHLIVYVELEDGGRFIDAATRYCPFGLLPPLCVTNGGFLLDGKKSRIVKMATGDPKSYRMDVTTINIEPDGSVKCTTNVKLTGYFTAVYGERWENEKPEDFVEDCFLGELGTEYDLEDVNFEKDETKNRCKMVLSYTLKDWVTKLENNMVVKLISFYYHDNPFESEERFFPVDFNYPFTYHDIINVNCSDSLADIQLPEDVSWEITGASYHRQSTRLDTEIKIESILKITKPTFAPREYTNLREFFINMTKAQEDQLILVMAQ